MANEPQEPTCCGCLEKVTEETAHYALNKDGTVAWYMCTKCMEKIREMSEQTLREQVNCRCVIVEEKKPVNYRKVAKDIINPTFRKEMMGFLDEMGVEG